MSHRSAAANGARAAWLLLSVVLWVTACGPREPAGDADASAASGLPATFQDRWVHMTVWAVPAVGHGVRLQVRLAPQVPIAAGTLAVAAGAASVSPTHFQLVDLQPPRRAPRPASPPNPPALGRTYVYTFTVTARRPGTYVLEIRLKLPNNETMRQPVRVVIR